MYTAGLTLILLLHLILYVYFFYTIVAIFKGAAFIPSKHKNVDRMMALANVQTGELVMDLGSGDGRILFAAARRGALCVGIEINPLLCWYTRLVSKLRKYRDVTIKRQDLWTTDLSAVDVLTIYMVPQHMPALQKKIKSEMKAGSRVVASVYHFKDWASQASDENVCLYVV